MLHIIEVALNEVAFEAAGVIEEAGRDGRGRQNGRLLLQKNFKILKAKCERRIHFQVNSRWTLIPLTLVGPQSAKSNSFVKFTKILLLETFYVALRRNFEHSRNFSSYLTKKENKRSYHLFSRWAIFHQWPRRKKIAATFSKRCKNALLLPNDP